MVQAWLKARGYEHQEHRDQQRRYEDGSCSTAANNTATAKCRSISGSIPLQIQVRIQYSYYYNNNYYYDDYDYDDDYYY